MIDPVAFHVGPLSVHWYGIFYGVGLVAGFFLMRWMIRKNSFRMTENQLIDFLFWIFLVGIILGGRLGYVLFYNLPYYLQHPAKIIAVWEGGMSFHGGLIGAIVVAIVYCRKKGIDLVGIADLTVIPAALGLALGRLGNFINGELVGRVIENARWKFLGIDSGDGLLRYPSQLFASFKDLLIFGILLFLFFNHPLTPSFVRRGDKQGQPKKGVLVSTFLILYGALRFIVEFWRAPDPQIGFLFGWMTLGQLLSAAVFTAGIILFRFFRKSR